MFLDRFSYFGGFVEDFVFFLSKYEDCGLFSDTCGVSVFLVKFGNVKTKKYFSKVQCHLNVFIQSVW